MSAAVLESVPLWDHGKIEFPDSLRFSPTEFQEFCVKNPDLNAELSCEGILTVMAPTGGTSGWRNSKLSYQLEAWVDRMDSGIAFDSSTVFRLPNGAMRGPDAAWIEKSRWDALSVPEQDGFPPICPDFLIELRSQSDRLSKLQEKMEEYMSNGARLGFLIDPRERKAHIYCPGKALEILNKPEKLSGDPELPGLEIQLTRIW